MKLSATLGMVLALWGAAVAAQADEIHDPLSGDCAFTYHSDSFGRGVEAAVLGGDRRPRLVDEGCYRLGMDWAARTAGAQPSESCVSEFESGRREGLEAGAGTDGSGCAGLGYQAGRADLDVGAREGDVGTVGQTCVDVYRQGVSDSKEGLAATVPDTFGPEAKTRACYNLGYFEGPLY